MRRLGSNRNLRSSRFSHLQLAIFIIAFSLIGYLIFRSFAAPNPSLPGDLNSDNTVNVTDLSILLSDYGTSNTAADINGDGTVNILDLSALLSHYGQSYVSIGLGAMLPAAMASSTGSIVIGSPGQSLSSLFSSVGSGQILELHGGTYGSGLTSAAFVSVSGTASAPITIRSYPGERAVIAQQVHITGSYIRLTDLTFDRNYYPTNTRFGQSGSNPGGNVNVWLDAAHITLEKSEIRNSTMSGIFGGSDYNQILNNYVHDNGTTHDDHGMYIGGGGTGSLIAGNLVVHNATFGIQIQYTSHDWIVANNTIVSNGLSQAGSGTVQSDTANNLLWVNNIVTSNGEVGFKSYVATGNVLSHNLAYANPQGATYGSFASVTSLLQVDPQFVSATDFHLQGTSPAKTYGDPAYTPAYDYDGQARSTASIGAYR